MPTIKLANGQAVQDIREWDGIKWVSRVGKVRTVNGWENFFKPEPSFIDDFTIRSGMILQNASALTKQSLTVGATSISVSNTANFLVGHEITITDGVNQEHVRVTDVGVNSLIVTPLSYAYPQNSIVARTTALLTTNGATFDTRTTYQVI
jgi:hypothetical protein